MKTQEKISIKSVIQKLGFVPKENESGIYHKIYSDTCAIEIDFINEIIRYGKEIKSDSKTTQNFSQPENFVVLECVNRLLEKGYSPQNIILEKTYPSGHGTSGRLDICYMPADNPFYPTDHCGVLRIKTNEILPKYLAWILNKEGINQKFSRTLRASIDRIKRLNIKFPSLSIQQKIIAKIEKIEAQIADLQQQLLKFKKQKELILEKYL
ncbi:MAG: restriction endonuclease subunit S [Planctomycetaceae bacterium]|jgi:restriction endonuclease S subunit|nr:restriction endonuclease subunit S [Planctomycetaceae bacterium]